MDDYVDYLKAPVGTWGGKTYRISIDGDCHTFAYRKDYYEDLTAEKLAGILDEFAAGRVPTPGPQNGRYAAEPLSGLTSLTGYESGRTQYNASVQLATDIGDTVKRIDGTEVPLSAPWLGGAKKTAKPAKARTAASRKTAKPAEDAPAAGTGTRPRALKSARKSGADDLKMIKGVGPKLEKLLNSLGFFHYDQIAAWSADEIAWVDENLQGFKGRVSRDGWVDQARILAEGGQTEFSKRAKY